METGSAGRIRSVQLAQGKVQYLDIGDGPTLLFVHGSLVGGEMWRKVFRPLSSRFRCVAPTLPLGGHTVPMKAEADLTPLGIARLIDDFMAALYLRDVTVVACDTGGAFTQLVAVHHPERVGRLVLTNCDAFENFLPPVLRPFQVAFRTPGFGSLFAASLRSRVVRRLLYAPLAHTPLEPRVGDSYFSGFIRDPQVRRDTRKVALGIHNRYTLEAARHFPAFHKPVLIAWGQDDWVFPPRFGERLARAFPGARLERVRGSKTFVSEDQPEVLGSLITAFAPGPVLV